MSVNAKSQKVIENHRKILQAASELFLQGGMQALSVRAISKRAGLSTIGIYSHFEGKQGILDALYIEGFERVALAMEVPDQGQGSLQRILSSSQAYLCVADEYQAHYRLIFGEVDENYQPSPEAREVAKRAFELLIKGAARLLPENASIQQKTALAIDIWAIVHGYVGLKNHSVANAVPDADWNQMAVNAVESHLLNIIDKQSID